MVATPSFEFDSSIHLRAFFKHQAVDALSWLPADGTINTPLEYGLPVLAIGRSAYVDDIVTTIFALKAYIITFPHNTKSTDGTDTTLPTLV